MLGKLTEAAFLKLAHTHQRIAVYYEIAGDQLTPINLYQALADELKQDGALLESGLQQYGTGRYSFLGFAPYAEFTAKQHHVTIRRGDKTEHLTATDPLDVLRTLLAECRCAEQQAAPHLVGGAVGFVTYDVVRLFEKLPDRHQDVQQLPDIVFRFYRTSITFDHNTQRITFTHLAECGDDPIAAYQLALQEIQQLVAKIHWADNKLAQVKPPALAKEIEIKTDLEDTEFKQRVLQAKKYLQKGDAFQIVLSRSFTSKLNTDAFTLYRALRFTSRAPYMFFIHYGDTAILGASPERLVKVENNKVLVNPIAGTRPRYKNGELIDLSEDLLNDKKEIAEHMMLVDLGRNDVGSISVPGSVQVEELMQVKYFTNVIHLVSIVSGELAQGKDALSALRATFPAGTLSGAPKIRAMDIIDELENSRRGIYGGGIVTIDNKGNLDSCIAIRTAIVQNNIATVRAGAGIVMDSDPQAEAEETRYKASSIFTAMQFAESSL